MHVPREGTTPQSSFKGPEWNILTWSFINTFFSRPFLFSSTSTLPSYSLFYHLSEAVFFKVFHHSLIKLRVWQCDRTAVAGCSCEGNERDVQWAQNYFFCLFLRTRLNFFSSLLLTLPLLGCVSVRVCVCAQSDMHIGLRGVSEPRGIEAAEAAGDRFSLGSCPN